MRKEPRQSRAIDKRNRVLDAAQRLIHETGYGKMTVAEVARLADVGKPTVYQLFADKEAILTALADRRAKLLEDAVYAAYISSDRNDLEAVLRAMIIGAYNVTRSDPSLDAVFAAALTVPTLRDRDKLQMRDRGRAFGMMIAEMLGVPYHPDLEVIGVANTLVGISIIRHALQYDDGFENALIGEAVQYEMARLTLWQRKQQGQSSG